MEAEHLERMPCPACGGAGGGPFGRAGSAWDDEEYVCVRCEGVGFVMMDDVMIQSQSLRPGLVKAIGDAAPAVLEPKRGKRKASA
jgi:hypothetical protein